MSHEEHFEAAQLYDDKGICEIVQTAQMMPLVAEDGEGYAQMSALPSEQKFQIFGRTGRGDTRISGIDKDLSELDQRPAKKLKGTAAKGGEEEERGELAAESTGSLGEALTLNLASSSSAFSSGAGTILYPTEATEGGFAGSELNASDSVFG